MNASQHRDGRLILVTGATGYIGSRLLAALEGKGHRLRCLTRRATSRFTAAGRTEVVEGDVLKPSSLPSALAGVAAAYYLIHSMDSAGDFEEQDKRAAQNFGRAAREAGVGRIIYLGGLGRGPSLSKHLASRQEVGRILRDSGVPTIEFRASVIIGSGSISFEVIRALVDRLPVMVTPMWVSTRAQPIAVEDVIEYLVSALDFPLDGSVVFEIGGAEQLSYLDLMKAYARERGLRRVMIPVPVLTPWLSSMWLHLVTPVHARVGRRLIEGVRNETLVTDPSASEAFEIRPRGVSEAIRDALADDRD